MARGGFGVTRGFAHAREAERVEDLGVGEVFVVEVHRVRPCGAEIRGDDDAAARGEAEDLGFLGARTLLGGKGTTVVQYWRSVEDIYGYASAPNHEHRPAWTAFNQRARRAPGAVGVWHETYVVSRAESVYVGMPPTGLAKVTSLVPVARNADRAAARLAAGATPSRGAAAPTS